MSRPQFNSQTRRLGGAVSGGAAQPAEIPPIEDTAWKLTFATTAPAEDINLTLGACDCHLDWGDGSSDDYTTGGTKAHTYAEAGDHTVSLSGTLASIDVYNTGVTMRAKLKAIQNKISGLTGFLTFAQAFKQSGLTGALPAGLFSSGCAGVTSFAECFSTCPNLVGPFPAGLFASCPLVTTFLECFAGCTGLISTIPSDLFGANSACLTIKGCFKAGAAQGDLPSALLAGMPNLTNVAQAFQRGPAAILTSLPTDFFNENTGITDFTQCFYNQVSMGGTAANLTPGSGLWNRSGPPEGLQCFYGCATLSDYATIPTYWKTG